MKIDKMIPQFTKDEIEIITQTFSTYRFENNEEELYYKCKREKGKIAFVTYKEHIMYSFNGFCKVVIRYAAIIAWRDRNRRRQREISFEYLTEEKFYL